MKKWKTITITLIAALGDRCSALKVASDLTNALEMEMDMEMAMKWETGAKGGGRRDNIVCSSCKYFLVCFAFLCDIPSAAAASAAHKTIESSMLHGPLDSLCITRVSRRERKREDPPAGCRICTFPMISASVVTLLASCSNSSGLHSTPLLLALLSSCAWGELLSGKMFCSDICSTIVAAAARQAGCAACA